MSRYAARALSISAETPGMSNAILDCLRSHSGIDISTQIDPATFVHWESNPAGFKFRMKSVGGIEQFAARLAASPSFAKVTLELDRIVKDDFGHKKVADYAFREWGRPNSLHVILFNDPLRSSIVHLDSHSVAVGKDSVTGSVIYSDDLKDFFTHVRCDLLHKCK
jgi:hypothetical protein